MKAIALLLLLVAASFAHGEKNEGIDARDLIEQNVSCSSLSADQLEAIGEYYMEQMHPGQQHVMMDNMMGGEDSQSLKDAHIAMAQRIYCGDETVEPPFSMSILEGSGDSNSLIFFVIGFILGSLGTIFYQQVK